MDRSRSSYHIKRGLPLGDRLIARDPSHHPEMREVLTPLGAIPASVTVGYYRVLTRPAGAIAFMPVNTDQAVALLAVPSVQERICEDLAAYVRQSKETQA